MRNHYEYEWGYSVPRWKWQIIFCEQLRPLPREDECGHIKRAKSLAKLHRGIRCEIVHLTTSLAYRVELLNTPRGASRAFTLAKNFVFDAGYTGSDEIIAHLPPAKKARQPQVFHPPFIQRPVARVRAAVVVRLPRVLPPMNSLCRRQDRENGNKILSFVDV